MKNTKKLKIAGLTALAGIISSSMFAQSVSLQINTGNFADNAGSPIANGALWGVVFDLDGNTFAGLDQANDLQLNPFDGPLTVGERPNTMLSHGGAGDLGLVWTAGSVTVPIGANAGPGGLGTANGVQHADGVGLPNTGDQFGLIWFPGLQDGDTPSAGDSYGFYTNADLLMPPSSVSAQPFTEFITNDIKTADYTIVPEPSTYAAIFGFGVLLFVFLRRRFKK